MKPLRFRPSAAHRWLSCPGSVWVANALPAESSEYAAEGTLAHAILAEILTTGHYLSEPRLPTDQTEIVEEAADLVANLVEFGGYTLRSEVEVSVKLAGQEIGGTADIVLINDESVIVLDYKHGAGRKVNAAANPQLTLYALAVRYSMVEAKGKPITIGILQPRGVGEGLDMWACDEEYLEGMRKNYEAAIKRAYAGAEPSFNRGPWCWGCLGRDRGACPAVLTSAILFAAGKELLEGETEETIRAPWWMLEHVDSTKHLASKLQEQAQEAIENGEKIPGWIVGWENGRRSWSEPDEVPEILAERTGRPVTDFRTEVKTTKVIGITDALKKCKGVDIVDLIKTPSKRVLRREGEATSDMDEVL